jgi:hypothetical protein
MSDCRERGDRVRVRSQSRGAATAPTTLDDEDPLAAISLLVGVFKDVQQGAPTSPITAATPSAAGLSTRTTASPSTRLPSRCEMWRREQRHHRRAPAWQQLHVDPEAPAGRRRAERSGTGGFDARRCRNPAAGGVDGKGDREGRGGSRCGEWRVRCAAGYRARELHQWQRATRGGRHRRSGLSVSRRGSLICLVDGFSNRCHPTGCLTSVSYGSGPPVSTVL